MKKYYLSHQTSDRGRGKVIQEKLEKELPIKIINPFYDEFGVPTKEIEYLDNHDIRSKLIPSSNIVWPDLKKVYTTEGTIAWLALDKFTCGCPVEIWECFKLGKPVYTISPLDNIRNHPFIKEASWKTFETVDEFIDWYKKEFIG